MSDERGGYLEGAVLAMRGFEQTMHENFIAALQARRILSRVHWFEGGPEFPLVPSALPIVVADAAGSFVSGVARP